jgi:aspartate/methionine/tyrosine aminotransferase
MARFDALSALDDVGFARELIETRGVAAIPPSVFYARPPGPLPWLRFAFCKRDETLRHAAAQLTRRI